MKLLFFAGGSYVSGLEIVTLHLIRQLKEEGHEIRCIVNGWNDGMFIGKLKEMDVPYEEVKLGWLYLRKPLWTLDTLVHLPGAFLKCRRIIRSFKPDVSHFCNYASVILLSPLLKDQACVYNLQEPHEPNAKNLSIYRMLNKRIGIFTAVSGYIEQVLIDLGIPRDKIKLVYNGVPVIQQTKPKPSEGRLVFAIIGQITSWKGHSTLIEAVTLMKSSAAPPFQIKVFGNDKTPYADEIKNKIASSGLDTCFSWEGFVKDQDMIYDQVDVVIVPSLSQEPCSLTILESMMRGKSLIVSDRGGNPELVKDGDTGFVFKADDPTQLAERMQRFLRNDDRIAPMGGHAYQAARERFTVEKMTEGYKEIYSDLASRTAGSRSRGH